MFLARQLICSGFRSTLETTLPAKKSYYFLSYRTSVNLFSSTGNHNCHTKGMNSKTDCKSALSTSSTTENEKKIDTSNNTVGIIIIGDEILKGHTKDTNASFLLSRLWASGLTVKKVSFVPDDVDIIASEVSTFSKVYSLVITAGGVGPTHDDMTYAGIAKAFDEEIKVNKEIKDMVSKWSGLDELSDALMKMVKLPESASLHVKMDPLTNSLVKFPLVNVHNVFAFPGVPQFLQKSFLLNKELFLGDSKFLLIKIYLSVSEQVVASCIEKIDKEYPDVHVGSYPMLDDIYQVKITLESEDKESIENAYDALVNNLPNDVIVSVKKCLANNRDTHEELFNSTKLKRNKQRHISTSQLSALSLVDLDHYLDATNLSPLSLAIKCAWGVLQQTVQMYSLDELCLGFNGGKDCTAVLHLYVACLKKMFPDSTKKIFGVYLKQSDPFEEAQKFIKDCEENYGMNMIIIEDCIKAGLTELKFEHPEIKAVIMGTRRHDPYSSKLRSFTMTDDDWPSFMRVFPILDWTYCEVWEFLRTFDLPYCRLYDDGYTSLGSKINTTKNPALVLPDGRYSPAYLLKDEDQERSGREKKK